MIQDVIQYGGIYNHSQVSTSDATPTEIGNIPVDDLTAGVLIVDVISVATDGSASNAGRYAVKYSKNTTLTLGAVTNIYQDNDAVISVAVVNDGGENIRIQATGIAATDITWIARTQILGQTFTGTAL